jgi:hypothetical protein
MTITIVEPRSTSTSDFVTWSELESIIRAKFQTDGRMIYLTYVDDDGDRITLDTDDELHRLLKSATKFIILGSDTIEQSRLTRYLEKNSFIQFTVNENAYHDDAVSNSSFSVVGGVRCLTPLPADIDKRSHPAPQEKIDRITARGVDELCRPDDVFRVRCEQPGPALLPVDIDTTSQERIFGVDALMADVKFEFEMWKSHRSSSLYWKVKSLKSKLEKMIWIDIFEKGEFSDDKFDVI